MGLNSGDILAILLDIKSIQEYCIATALRHLVCTGASDLQDVQDPCKNLE
jgi:hypothetical protein